MGKLAESKDEIDYQPLDRAGPILVGLGPLGKPLLLPGFQNPGKENLVDNKCRSGVTVLASVSPGRKEES